MIFDSKVRSLQPGDRIVWRQKDKTVMFLPPANVRARSEDARLWLSHDDDKGRVAFLRSETDWNEFVHILAWTSGCNGLRELPVDEHGNHIMELI